LGSAFFFLRCFKLAHIGIQVTSLHRCNKQGINHIIYIYGWNFGRVLANTGLFQ